MEVDVAMALVESFVNLHEILEHLTLPGRERIDVRSSIIFVGGQVIGRGLIGGVGRCDDEAVVPGGVPHREQVGAENPARECD